MDIAFERCTNAEQTEPVSDFRRAADLPEMQVHCAAAASDNQDEARMSPAAKGDG